MEQSTNRFKYRALNPLANEIRVIILEPYSKTESPARVHCTLLNVCLDDSNRPSYEALSYVWGDASLTEPIFLEGKPFTITRALWTALRYLRLEDRQRTIWVDAICINQEDIKEREELVGCMSEVYKYALRCLLWMDIPGTAIQHVLPLLEKEYPDNEKGAADFALNLMEHADVRILRGYNLLCADPVWGRSWIVQEIILSPAVSIVTQNATFNALNLQHLAMAASRFLFTGFHRLPEEEHHSFGTNSIRVRTSYDYRTAHPLVTSLIRAWQYFCFCRSTDPRDRIYSLLSISDDHLGISPDYHISPKELYSKVARASIFQSKNLDILCLGYLENSPMTVFTREAERISEENLKQSLGIAEDGNLPSWLPLFNLVGTPSSLLAALGLAAQYNAGKWPFPPEFDQIESFTDPDILSLTGVRIDTVGPIDSALYEVCPDMENVLLKNFVDPLPTKPYPKTYFTGEDSFEAYWRTSIFDRNCTVGRLSHELKKSYRQIAASWIAVNSELQGSDYKNHPFL